MVDEVQKAKAKICAVYGEPTRELTEAVGDCVIPHFSKTTASDYGTPQADSLLHLRNEYKDLFHTLLGCTTAAEHFIPPPPPGLPANYRVEIERQIEAMLEEGIIESSSAWMPPAVFVCKKMGDIRLCVDNQELSKRTVKDVYPLPRPDEMQDHLAGSKVFSTLDLQ